MRKSDRIVCWMAYAVGAAYVLLFLTLVGLRLVYPYEVEWNEGAILDHALRITEHQPLYTAPSVAFGAFVYTPLYYITAGLLMKFTGSGYAVGRAISLFATFATAWLISRVVIKESGSRTLGLLSIALYLAFYQHTGYFFDLVRMDALALLLGMSALYIALYSDKPWLSAILLALAYFTKQQMLMFFIPVAVHFWINDRRSTLPFVLYAIGGIVLLTVLSALLWPHWYWFYTYRMPATKGTMSFSWLRALLELQNAVVTVYGIGWLGTITFLVFARKQLVRVHGRSITLAAALGAASCAAAMGIGNDGGYKNVEMPLAAMTAICLPVFLATLADHLNLRPSFIYGGMLLQFFALVYDPTSEKMVLASPRQRAAGDEFVRKVSAMPGEIYIPYHGYLARQLGKQSHIHIMALFDALTVGDTTSERLRREFDSAYTNHRFAAVIADECPAFPLDTVVHYHKSGSVFTIPNVFLARYGDAATRPQFIWTP